MNRKHFTRLFASRESISLKIVAFASLHQLFDTLGLFCENPICLLILAEKHICFLCSIHVKPVQTTSNPIDWQLKPPGSPWRYSHAQLIILKEFTTDLSVCFYSERSMWGLHFCWFYIDIKICISVITSTSQAKNVMHDFLVGVGLQCTYLKVLFSEKSI